MQCAIIVQIGRRSCKSLMRPCQPQRESDEEIRHFKRCRRRPAGTLLSYRLASDHVFDWLARRLSIPPVVTGAACSLALGAFALWCTWLIGTVDDVAAGLAPDIAVRAPVTLYMMVGYLPMAIYYLGAWTSDHLAMLASSFALAQRDIAFPRAIANMLGIAGAVTMYFLFLHETDDPLRLISPLRWSGDFALPLVGLILMGWFIFRFMFLLIWNALCISRTAKQIDHIDLFDTPRVRPYAQQGVRSSLLAVVGLSISANLWLDPNSPTVGTASSVIMLVAASALALLLPTWGIHQRLKVTKQTELEQIRKAIAARKDPQTRTVEDAHQLRADLAIETRVKEVSEWPFDAGSYGRVALYILLGLGSWVGAALVERLLEVLGA